MCAMVWPCHSSIGLKRSINCQTLKASITSLLQNKKYNWNLQTMNYLQIYSPLHQSLQLATIVTILALFTPISATNLTEQYRLCKTQAEIEGLQTTHNLTRVDAHPVHGALQPSWPETVVTVIFSIYGLNPSSSNSKPGHMTFISKAVVPFIMVLAWTISLINAEINYSTAGWIPPNQKASITAFITANQYQGSGSDSFVGSLISFLSLVL